MIVLQQLRANPAGRKWYAKLFLKNPLDYDDNRGILRETRDGDSHNDIKRGYLKCWSSMAEADIVFPNPTDLAGVAVVSESLKVLTRFGR